MAAAWRLLERGLAYKCFCTKEELEAKRQQALAEKRNPDYPGPEAVGRDPVEGRCSGQCRGGCPPVEAKGARCSGRRGRLRRPVALDAVIRSLEQYWV